MNAISPHLISQPDANTSAVLYGLLKAQNPELTVPLSGVTFGTPQLNTAALSAANGNTTSSVQLSSSTGDAPVTIFYNQVNLANHVVQPTDNFGSNLVSVFILPPGAYATTLDAVPALQAAGYPITASDVNNVALQNFWPDPAYYTYRKFGYQYLEMAASSLGYIGDLFLMYGPPTVASLATEFSVTKGSASSYSGDAVAALASYNPGTTPITTMATFARPKSITPHLIKAEFPMSRAFVTYSGLTVLDAATSSANSGAEVSALVTYGVNPTYLPVAYSLNPPFWPFYEGSQTVYYSRLDPSNVSNILGSPTLDVNGAFNLPIGPELGVSVTKTSDIVKWLAKYGWNNGFDTTDIVDAPLPAYDVNGVVVTSLTFQNSYMVKDGAMPITLTNAGPDMSVITTGYTDIPTSATAGQWNYLFADALTSDPLGSAACTYWYDNYYSSTEQNNWCGWLKGTVVPGTVQATSAADALAHSGCGFQATIDVVTPWGASFQVPIFYDKINLTNLSVTMGLTDGPGVLTLETPSNVFSVPMRVIDWLLNNALVGPAGSGGYRLNNYINWRELSNLNDLVLPDANGDLSFTITAATGSNIMEGSLTITIKNGTALTSAATAMASMTGAPGWVHVVTM